MTFSLISPGSFGSIGGFPIARGVQRPGGGASTTPRAFYVDENDGTFIRVPYSASLSMRDNITVSVWIKSDSITGAAGILGRSNPHPAALRRVWAMEIHNDLVSALQLLSTDGLPRGYAALFAPVIDGRPHHLLWTYANGVREFRVDNVVHSTTYVSAGGSAISGNLADFDTDLTIGALLDAAGDTGAHFFFNGWIYQPRVFNKVLNNTEKAALYNGGRPVELSQLSFAANCVASYRFDRTDTVSRINDESGNGNHGVLYNGTMADNFVDFTPAPRYAVQFNGTNQRINVPHSSSLAITDDLTVVALFRAGKGDTDTSGVNGALGMKGDWTGTGWSWWFEMRGVSQQWGFFTTQNGTNSAKIWYGTNANLASGAFYFMAMVIANDTARLNFQGADVASGSINKVTDNALTALAATSEPISVGAVRQAGSPSVFLSGELSFFGVYAKTGGLSESQLAALNTALRAGDDITALDSWSDSRLLLQLGSDPTQATTFVDISPYGNHGTGVNLTTASFVPGFTPVA